MVEAKGYGTTYDRQLHDAKLEALRMVLGSFIVGHTIYKSDKDTVFENILEYHGGFIANYEVIRKGIDYVLIKAHVQRVKDNRLYVEGDNEIDITDQLNNYKSKRDIIEYLDDPKQAFHINVKGIQIDPQPYKVRFKISSILKWQPKWISDLETFVKTSTNVGKTSNQINVRMVSQRGYDPAIGIVQSMFSSKPKQSDIPMICFAGRSQSDIDGCRNLAGGFQNMPIYSELPVIIRAYDKDKNEVCTIRVHIDGNNLNNTICFMS